MPDKKTTLYLNMGNGNQVKVEMTHESEPLPTPQEVPSQREVTVNEMEAIAEKLCSKEYYYKPIF